MNSRGKIAAVLGLISMALLLGTLVRRGCEAPIARVVDGARPTQLHAPKAPADAHLGSPSSSKPRLGGRQPRGGALATKLRGRVEFRSGSLHRPCFDDGHLTVRWVGEAGMAMDPAFTVPVDRGSWTLDADNAAGHSLVVEEAAFRSGKALPLPGPMRVAAASESILAVAPWASCRVVDERTREPLSDVDGFFEPLKGEGASPGTFRTPLDSLFPRRERLRPVSSSSPSPVFLLQQPEDGVFWFTSAGYGWGSVTSAELADSRTPVVAIQRAGDLSVTCVIPERHDSALAIALYRRSPAPSPRSLVRLSAVPSARVTSLHPGRYLVRLESGRSEQHAAILAEESIDIREGRESHVDLVASSTDAEPVQILGSVTTAREDAWRTLSIRISPLSENASRQVQRMKLTDDVIPSNGELAPWEAPGLVPGRYLFEVLPLGYSQVEDLCPGINEVRLDVPTRRTRYIHVLDADTGRGVVPSRLAHQSVVASGDGMDAGERWQAEFLTTTEVPEPAEVNELMLPSERYRFVVHADGYGLQEIDMEIGPSDGDVYLLLNKKAEIRIHCRRPMGEAAIDSGWLANTQVRDAQGIPLEVHVAPLEFQFGESVEYLGRLTLDYAGPCRLLMPAQPGLCGPRDVELTVKRGGVYAVEVP